MVTRRGVLETGVLEVFNAPQPDWLLDIAATPQEEDQGPISPKQLEVIVDNTITVITEMPEKREEWHETMEGAFQQAQRIERTQDAEFFAAILAILDEQTPSLPEDHSYRADLEKIQAGIAAGGSQEERVFFAVSEEVMQTVRDFINAENWDVTRQVVESQQAFLFQPEVETLFEQNIAHAQAEREERTVQMLEMHLALLRECKASSIEDAFAKLAASEEEEDALPFDADLISRSIAALLGSPQEKVAHMQYLTTLANETTNEELKALLNTIQLAMFSEDLSQFGRELKGIYRQTWETIVATVEAGGVNPETFEKIVDNTLAVLGPTASQRTVWRGNLTEIRNQATARGDRNMVALLDAVIGLLDAGGNPADLGGGLKGIYAKTWQAIVEKAGS